MNNEEARRFLNFQRKILNADIQRLFQAAVEAQLAEASPGAQETENEATLLQPDDYNAMIDLALATNDKEWFLELTGKMQSVAV